MDNKMTFDRNVYQWLEGLLNDMAEEEKLSYPTLLTRDFHLYPDFHGNRSPLADPTVKGMVRHHLHSLVTDQYKEKTINIGQPLLSYYSTVVHINIIWLLAMLYSE